jgi:glyoxylase-like metal-dependent hydrolase (beta-lactamase superfamily II)
MNLIALPAFTDNCFWMYHEGRMAVVVDPGESAPVIAALDAQKLDLAAILVTQHPGDHVGGVAAYTDPCIARSAEGQPTLPSSVARDRGVNPFLRCDDTAVVCIAHARSSNPDEPVAVLAALRQWKNDFR